MPPLNQLYGELRGRGLEVRLVTFREDPDTVRRVARERGYVAPVLLDRSGDTAGRAWGVFGPPTAYLIDRRGRLVGRVLGGDWAGPTARAAVEALLAGRPLP